jgi:hypothetical protein
MNDQKSFLIFEGALLFVYFFFFFNNIFSFFLWVNKNFNYFKKKKIIFLFNKLKCFNLVIGKLLIQNKG